jgi:lycopene cyclase domain-containing protein
MVLCGRENTLYLGLITAWALPVIALQWFFGGHVSWRERRLLGMAIASPTLYMWVADAVAIQLGIWAISPHYLVGVYMGPLPLEEALFFLLTNCMVRPPLSTVAPTRVPTVHSLPPEQVAQGALLFARVAERLEQDGQEGKRGAGSGAPFLQQPLLLSAQAIFRAARRL